MAQGEKWKAIVKINRQVSILFTRPQQPLFTQIGNWQLTRSSSLLIVIATFFFSLLGSTAIIRQAAKERLREKQEKLAAIADDYSVAIQRDIEQTLSLTYTLANLVEEYQGIIPNFENVAQNLFPFYQGVGSLALLPEDKAAPEIIEAKVIGALTEVKINPQEITCSQSPSSFTGSVLTNANSYPELSLNTIEASTIGVAKIAVGQNMVTQASAAKPFGFGCLPIFLAEKTNRSSFWGFTSVLIDYSLLLQDLDWESLTQKGVAYQLEIVPDDDNPTPIIVDSLSFDSLRAIAVNPIVKSFKIAGETWTLNLSPIDGWQQRAFLIRAYLMGLLGSLIFATLIKVDLDARLKLQESEKITYLDPLTRLPNDRILKYRLRQILRNPLNKDQNLVLCHLNLDNFREINQQFGRRVGDYLLVRIATRLQKFLRAEDVVVRLEGDEFGLVLQNIQDCQEAEKILERIMDAVSNPIYLEESTISLSVSIGATIYPQQNAEIHNPHQDMSCQNSYLIQLLLTQAKRSLLQTKQQKGSYLFFKDLCQFKSASCRDAESIGIESSKQN